jgi:nucleoside-diphosphate-sugar epimerase
VQQVYHDDTGKTAEIKHVENPRVELEDHYYNPENQKLKDLGYRRKRELKQEISVILKDLEKYRSRILKHQDSIMPKTIWKA